MHLNAFKGRMWCQARSQAKKEVQL